MSKLTAESAPARAAAGSYKTSPDPKAQSVGGARDVTGASSLSAPAMHAPAPYVAGAVAGVPVAAPAFIPSTTQQRADELQNQANVAIRTQGRPRLIALERPAMYRKDQRKCLHRWHRCLECQCIFQCRLASAPCMPRWMVEPNSQ